MERIFEMAPFFALYGVIQAASLWAFKWLLDHHAKAQEKRLENLSALIASESKATQEVKHDLLRLREELARDYIRKDDFVRFGTTLTAKIDGLTSLIDALKERIHERLPRSA